MRPRIAFALLLASLMLVPAGAAQEGAATTLYFHLDAHQDFPINTQPPDDRFARDDGLGLTAVSASCVPEPTGLVAKSLHTFYGFSSPGLVEYGVTEDGGPLIHPERGLSFDVELDPAGDAVLYWYLETRPLGGADPSGATHDLPTVIPEVEVVATIRTGDDVGLGATAYNEGQVIASGVSGPQLMAPDANLSPNYRPGPDGNHVYEFVVPLDIATLLIPRDEAYNLRIDLRMAIPGCTEDLDATLMTSQVRIHTSPEFRPRLDWSVMNPVIIESIVPKVRSDFVAVEVALNSPWGNYDIDAATIAASFNGPSTPQTTAHTAFLPPPGLHGHHFEPITGGFTWWYPLDEAERGEYTVEIWAENLQKTGSTTSMATFDLRTGQAVDSSGNVVAPTDEVGSNDSPGVGLLAMFALVAAAFVARRRN